MAIASAGVRWPTSSGGREASCLGQRADLRLWRALAAAGALAVHLPGSGTGLLIRCPGEPASVRIGRAALDSGFEPENCGAPADH
jgi:hypothetical protein